MSKKKNSIFSVLLLVALASVCYLSISPVNTGVELKGKQNNANDNVLSPPKTSGATKLWNFSSDTEANALAVSADGKYMAVGTMNPVAKIYYFNTSNHGGKPMWSYDTGGYQVYKIAISSNGSLVIAQCWKSASEARAILLNSTKPTNGPKLEMWNVSQSEITGVDISADGKYIAIGVGEDGVQVYNNSCPSAGGRNKTGDYIWAYDAPEPVRCAAISDDGRYVAAGSDYVETEAHDVIYFFNNSIKHYGENNEQHSYNWTYSYYDGSDYSINSIAISKDGYYIAGSSGSGIAFLLNASKPVSGTKQEKWIVNGSFIAPGVITDVEFNAIDISANGNYIVLGGAATFDESDWSGFVFLYDNQYNSSGGRDKSDEMLWAYATNESVSSVSISYDGTYIVAGTGYNPDPGDDGSIDENTVFLFKNPGKISANPPLNTPIFAFNTSQNVNSVSISSSGTYFAAAGIHSSGMTYLFYYDATIPTLLPAGDDDDDDDGGEPAAIPFGSYYLVFTLVTVVSLVLIYKRKAILSKN